MSENGHDQLCCTIKVLPEDQWVKAAEIAVKINPANAPATQMLALGAPDHAIPPAHLALVTSKYWHVGGVNLTVGFLDNPPADLRARILSHMNAWGSWARVTFKETTHAPQVRIARGDSGYWSYLGTDILSIAAGDPTMNLQGFSMSTPESEFHRVIRHETGHTLGFPHEHLRKAIVDRIDPAKAIAYFLANDGWDAATTTQQVLTPMDDSTLSETPETDTHSIMCYQLPASIMKDGVAVDGGTDIDALDAKFASTMYPTASSRTASIWPNGKAYFFHGSQYVRYDPVADKADPGYPKPIAGNWAGMPANFASGIDAVVLWNNGKAYFFKGPNYVRYDTRSWSVDPGYPKPIAGNWPGLGGHKIDAGLLWPTGKAYFFSGSQYVRFDIAANKVDAGYPKPIAGNWVGVPAPFAAGVSASVSWDNGKAYLFNGSQYVRYDIAADKVDAGYPKPIAGNWPGLWSSAIDA